MSRTQTRATDTDTDTAHSDDLDDRAERVVDHARELERLREEKRERLHDADHDTTRLRDLVPSLGSGDAVKTGWIRDAERKGNLYLLDVDIPEDGDTHTETFRLDWPDDIEEAHVENDVIALAHLVGDSDGLDDILEQEVPVVETEDGYHLDLPETPARRHRYPNWLRRRLVSGGVLEYEGGDLQVNDTVGYAALFAGTAPVLAVGLLTLAASVSSFPTILSGVVLTIVTGLASAVVALIAGAMFGDPEGNAEPDLGLVVFALILAATAVYALVSTPDAATVSRGIVDGLVPYAASVLGGFVLAITGGIGTFVPVAKAGSGVVGWAADKARAAGRWVNRRRGIDYWR